MNQLYRHKWESGEGQILDAQGNYTSGFLLWCRKTEELNDEEWKRGFEQLEQELREAERQGEREKVWPPAYPAFIEKCKAVQNLSLYKPFDRSLMIEDKTAKEKRKKIGREQMANLLSTFD